MAKVPLPASFDPRMIPDDKWVYRGANGDGTIRYYTYTDTSLDLTIEKKEYVLEDELLKLNRHQFNESEGKRWGDGKPISRIPMHVYAKDFAGRHNDPDFNNWWHNREENQIYRTRKGKI